MIREQEPGASWLTEYYTNEDRTQVVARIVSDTEINVFTDLHGAQKRQLVTTAVGDREALVARMRQANAAQEWQRGTTDVDDILPERDDLFPRYNRPNKVGIFSEFSPPPALGQGGVTSIFGTPQVVGMRPAEPTAEQLIGIQQGSAWPPSGGTTEDVGELLERREQLRHAVTECRDELALAKAAQATAFARHAEFRRWALVALVAHGLLIGLLLVRVLLLG